MSRYKYQIACPFIEERGQLCLKTSTVLIVGAGGLGSNVAMSLTRMGVGTIRIVDDDVVRWSNLHRQGYAEVDVDAAKVIALAKHLRAANRDVRVQDFTTRLDASNIGCYAGGADVIIDATDNRETRLLIDKYAYAHCIPWIYGGCAGVQGAFATLIPGKTPCFGCIFGTGAISDTTTGEGGIVPPVVNLVANWQAIQAVKVLMLHQKTDPLLGKLVLVNGWTGKTTVVNTLSAAKDTCPNNCGKRE